MIRENILKIMKEGGKTLFIPKNGGLFAYINQMLPEIGLNIGAAELKTTGRATISNLELLLARGEDIPKRVEEYNEEGKRAYGLTGDDLFDEYRTREEFMNGKKSNLVVLNTYDWFDEKAKYNRPALCLMNKTGRIEDIPERAKVAINNKYEFTSKFYLTESSKLKRVKFTFSSYSGDTEASVSDNTNDCCVEIVYSGKTAEDNCLKVADTVRFSDIVLIGEDPSLFGKLISEDYKQIEERMLNPKLGSYTTGLLGDGKDRRDKLISEAAEVFSAIEGRGNLKSEISDLFYAINTVMVGEGISQREVAYEMLKRLK